MTVLKLLTRSQKTICTPVAQVRQFIVRHELRFSTGHGCATKNEDGKCYDEAHFDVLRLEFLEEFLM